MWVKFKKNYTGELGMFARDHRQDLPDAAAKKLIAKKICIATCPPWDDHKDHKLAAKEALLTQEAKLGKQIAALQQPLADAQDAADKIPAITDFLQDTINKHKAVLEELESLDKGKKNAKPNNETAEAGSESQSDDDNAKGQAAKAGKA